MRFLRFREVRLMVGLSRSTIWRLQRAGMFPRSRRIGKSATAWLESEVLEWMKERAQVGTSGWKEIA